MKERIWDAIRPQGNPNTLFLKGYEHRMIQINSNILFFIIIIMLLLLVLYLNRRVNYLEDQLLALSSATFSTLGGLASVNYAQKLLVDIVRNSIDNPESSELDEASEVLDNNEGVLESISDHFEVI